MKTPGKTALIFCAAYVAGFAFFFVIGYGADTKGRFVLQQLAVFPALGLLDALGFRDFLAHELNSFPIMFVLNVFLALAVGWIVGEVRLVVATKGNRHSRRSESAKRLHE
jgi:hypothetical protein